ncbi:MAG TPA: S9 family peptidase [Bacteroidota bacterium]|nr:S9 family peptidase [Bacteroidota bacterium]
MKNIFITILVGILCAVPVSSSVFAQAKRPMELEDMFRAKRVADPQVSPDGKWVAYTVTIVDKENNSTNSDIWVVPSGGGEAKQLTNSPKQDRHQRWSPDGKRIAFESNRDGSFQIYTMSNDGSNVKQLTTISTEGTQPVWSPDGKWIAFVSAVYPEFSDKPFKESDAANKGKLDAIEKSKVKAHIITKLLYRHWDSWVNDMRQHMFVVPSDSGEPRDLTPGDRDASPTSSTFSTGDDYDFSPDSKELAYTATPVPVHDESWSTNHDIYTVNLATGERKQITTNKAADITPRYSPDGKYIAYRAQEKPGYESDKWQLLVYNRATGATRSLTKTFDSWVEEFTWNPNSTVLYFGAEEKGQKAIWSVSIKGDDVKKVVEGGTNGDVVISNDGTMLYFSRAYYTRPVEIYAAGIDGKGAKAITNVNDALFSQIAYTEPEQVTYTGAAGAKVQMWIIKPPMFDATKKYPYILWVHGGPQGAWLNAWSNRWNPELWAAQGYVLALPNPRGSTGFGQKFVAEISKDWAGKVYTDVMNGQAYMEKQPYVDVKHMAAAGASYGGYFMNWLEGHTDRFKTIVTHDGVYNFSSMYGVTDETWFEEYEHGIPWETKASDKDSPNNYVKNFKTPMLIIDNEGDYRVPFDQGAQLFTALQRRGIASKMLDFPNEGHWVLKPLDSELWHKTIFDWLAQYLKQ